MGDTLYQRSMMDPQLEWKVSLVKKSVDPKSPSYNAKAARAKLMSRNTSTLDWKDLSLPASKLAHADEKMECYSCHTSLDAQLLRLPSAHRGKLEDRAASQ